MNTDNKNEDKPTKIKNLADLQRLKLEKLMKNIDKPVVIPERPKTKNTPSVPDFVRNVMGSSAGAGSGEFHVYRHLRRKEYARQKFIQAKSEAEKLNDQYREKLEANKRKADEITAKKRAKRLKKKLKAKNRKKDEFVKETKSQSSHSEESDNESDNSNEQLAEKNTESKDDQINSDTSNEEEKHTVDEETCNVDKDHHNEKQENKETDS